MSADENANHMEETTGKKYRHSMLAIILIAFIAGAAGGFVVKILPWGGVSSGLHEVSEKEKPSPDTPNVDPDINAPVSEKGESETEIKTEPGLLELAEFVTNLDDPFAKRAIDVEFKLLLSDKALVDKIKKNKILMADIRHTIHMILSTKSYKDLRGASGKTVLFEEVMMQANEVIKEAIGVEPVIKVLHTVWKVQ